MKGGHLNRSLKDLVDARFVAREGTDKAQKVLYSITAEGLKTFRRIEAAASLGKTATRIGTDPSLHIGNIAAGLKSLSARAHIHSQNETLLARQDYEKYALQHLSFYKRTYKILPVRICEQYLSASERTSTRTWRLNESITADRNRLVQTLKKRLEKMGTSFEGAQTEYLLDNFISRFPQPTTKPETKENLEGFVWADPESRQVGVRSRVLCTGTNHEDAVHKKASIVKALLSLHDLERRRLNVLRQSIRKLDTLESKFCSEVNELIMKLLDMKRVRGKCSICK